MAGRIIPPGLRCGAIRCVDHTVSYDLTDIKTMSNSSRDTLTSHKCSAFAGTVNDSSTSVTVNPRALMASICAGHWSIKVRSCPARNR